MIIELDPVHSKFSHRVSADKIAYAKELLSYPSEFWKKTGYKRTRVPYQKTLLEKDTFLSGFTEKLSRELELPVRKIEYDIEIYPPELPGVEIRPHQKDLIMAALENHRGIILAPTGSGKTVVAGFIFSSLRDYKRLFLCHTGSIAEQTYRRFKEYGFNASKFGDDQRDLSGDVVVGMIQSVANIPIDEICDIFEVVLVDECHHASDKGGKKKKGKVVYSQYYTFLTQCLAPIRIGVTATMPPKIENQLVLEGLFGPVIGEFTLEEAIEKGILAKPSLELIPSPHRDLKGIKGYKPVYNHAIVSNRLRNRTILARAMQQAKENKSVIIYVREIEHIENLIDIADRMQIDLEVVFGDTPIDERMEIQKDLNDKKVLIVISSVVWKEGVDIPTLDTIINGAGGKSEIAVLQSIGRGLRKTDEKDSLLIIDFIDRGPYVSEHSCERLCIYHEKGWL